MHRSFVLSQIKTSLFFAFSDRKGGVGQYVYFFIIIALNLSLLSEGQARDAKGATKHKVRHVKLLDVDIEDLVRAEDDPGFAEFLKERDRKQHVDQSAIEEHKRERQIFENNNEKKRVEFIKERSITKRLEMN